MVPNRYAIRIPQYRLRFVVALLCLLFLAAVRPVTAAPPVRPDTRPVQVGHYDQAARRLRFREWTSGFENRTQVHLFLRLSQGETIFTVALPPDTPRAEAEQWFQGLTDALRWRPRSLHSNVTPTGLYLRAEAPGLVREDTLYRRQTPLQLQVLHERLPQITALPAYLVVRAATDADFSSSGPAAQGQVGEGQYAFYRLATPGASRWLRLRYGSTGRWMAALVTAAFIWLFLPLAALLAARRHLTRRPGTTPEADRDRLQDYRRWQRGILLTGVLGGIATLSILGFTRVVQVVFRFHHSAVLLVFVVPLAWLLITGRLVGLPLERKAYPIRKDLPWYRAAVGELIAALAMLALPALFIALDSFSGTLRPVATPDWLTPRVATAVVVGVIGVLIYAGQAWSAAKWRRRKDGTSREPLAPEALTQAIRELTARLDCPIERVYLLPKSAMLGQLAVQVRDGVAIVAKELTEQLRTEQIAGLAAASALTLRVSKRDTLIDHLLIGLTLLPIVLLALMIAIPALSGARFPGWMMPMLMLSAMSTSIFSVALARRTQKRSEDSDLTVSDALEEPRLFLNTLRDLEELQVASSGMDPAAAGKNPVLTRRRTRLQERLGLD